MYHFFSEARIYLIILGLVILLVAVAQSADIQKNSVVELDSGFIEGVVNQDVIAFKGVPYAAPPTEHFRWRDTQPVQPWIGIRKTVGFGADCMQKPNTSSAAMGIPPAEDCLFLNVWRSNPIHSGDALPVIVWIYGGGFVNGGASNPIFDGAAFAKKGVIFVSFNYRLGRFGFFAHPALTAASEGALGNYGYMDQIYALKWVRRNIAAFGGDPKRITVMGESAGGISILTLMTSQAIQNLFDRAIVLSGGGRTELIGGLPLNTGPSTTAEETGVNFAALHGIQGSGVQALAALRLLPAEQVRGDLNMSSLISETESKIYAGGPILDGKILKAQPEDIFRRGTAAKIPLLIGTTGRDISYLPAKTKDEVFAMFGAKENEAKAVYDPTGQKTLDELIQDVSSDQLMNEPARFAAKSMTKMGKKTWLYRFYYVADSLKSQWKGALHASELPFLFETVDTRFGNDVTVQDRAVASEFNNYMCSFAKTGDPNGSGQSTWTAFDPNFLNIMSFKEDASTLLEADPWKDRLDLMEWLNDLLPATSAGGAF